MTQAPTWTCDVCGQTVPVSPTASPYHFTAPCRCDTLLAWATKHAPPAFEGLASPQGRLF